NGPYQPSVFYNRQGRGFVEARQVVGLDRLEGETQILVAEDVDDDGDRDLVVAGTDLLPRVLRNDVVPPGVPLSLRLRGTTSNHLGVGAVVQVTSPGLPLQTRMVGGEARFQSAGDHLIVVAAGAGTSTVRVTWPTGREQVVALPAGRHEVVEPPLITLSEADRHLPADGASPLVVTVTPTTPDGA